MCLHKYTVSLQNQMKYGGLFQSSVFPGGLKTIVTHSVPGDFSNSGQSLSVQS